MEFVYRPTDLNELIRSMKETMRMRVQPGVELGYVLGADTCYVETEPNRLQQVITNLLTNACKFTAKGSITFGYEIRVMSFISSFATPVAASRRKGRLVSFNASPSSTASSRVPALGCPSARASSER